MSGYFFVAHWLEGDPVGGSGPGVTEKAEGEIPAADGQGAAVSASEPTAEEQPDPDKEQAQTQQPVDEGAEAHRAKLERFRKTSRLLNNQIFLMEDLSGLHLADSNIEGTRFNNCDLKDFYASKLNFRNCAFNGSDFSKAHIRNSIFEGCTFENVNMDEARFYDVKFIDCKFISTKREQGFSKGRTALTQLYNVVYVRAEFEDYQFFQLSGRVHFVDSVMDGVRLSVDGDSQFYKQLSDNQKLDLILQECTGDNFKLESRRVSSTLRVINSSLSNAEMHGFQQAFVEGGTLEHTVSLMTEEWLVVKEADVCAQLTCDGTMYLIGNNYRKEASTGSVNSLIKGPDANYYTTRLRPATGGTVYVDGGNRSGAVLTIFGGVVYIKDLELSMAFFDVNHSGKDSQLNLKNVVIENGYMYNSGLSSAYWEDVTIKKTMPVRKVRVDSNFTPKPILFHNLTLPEGEPCLDSGYYTLVESAREKWPEYTVPSLR